MVFLHSETTWTITRLIQLWDKSSYVDQWTITGHLKPLSIEDSTFDVSGISGAIYKLTVKGKVETSIKQADKFKVWSDEYVVKDVKPYNWINFNTTKILLVIE